MLARLHATEHALRLSEERYRLLAENSLDLVALLDREGTILYASPSHSRVLGYQPDALIQTTLFDRIHPDDLPQARAAVQAVLADRTAYSGEWRLLRQTGEHILATVQLSLSSDQRGAERLIVAARDISACRQAEVAMRQSQQRFRALVEHSADAIGLVNASGTIQYVSPAMTRMLGYRAEERTGRSVFERMHPDDGEKAWRLFQAVLQRPGSSVTGQMRVRHRNGTWRWLETVWTNRLAEPSVQAVVGNFRDITKRKHAQELLLKKAEEEARLEGVVLAGRELADLLNNNMVAALSILEWVPHQVAVPADLAKLLQGARESLYTALEGVAKLRRVVRVATKDTVVGPVLDLDRSSE
ncbi:MAG TPA: PAS domain S-box protein [Chloroflexota bacterium]|nr:PAS domain S-box protein [Chloroflexota bacterium]HZU06245.1 PAS domain S-box protein [Chloroflexota bacterium]